MAADTIANITPTAALGEDVVIDFAGTVDPSGWTLAVYLGYAPNGPKQTLAGVTVTNPSGNTIRVTIPAAVTATLTVGAGNKGRLYGEIWREDASNYRVLRRFVLGYYDPVRE